jgi:hypothetical protein
MRTITYRPLLRHVRLGVSAVALVLVAGCAQTVVQPQAQTWTQLPRPPRVLVYDFAVSPEEIHSDQDVLRQVVNTASGLSASARDAELGHKVADRFAEELLNRIQAMGLPAKRASRGEPVYRDDVEIVGTFLDIDQGNQLRRLVIGFGVGASQVDAEAEVLQVSERGPRRVAQFSTHADSGEMPGAAVTMGAGAAVSGGLTVGVAAANVAATGVKAYRSEIERMAGRSADRAAAYLAQVFAQQGWIAPPPR